MIWAKSYPIRFVSASKPPSLLPSRIHSSVYIRGAFRRPVFPGPFPHLTVSPGFPSQATAASARTRLHPSRIQSPTAASKNSVMSRGRRRCAARASVSPLNGSRSDYSCRPSGASGSAPATRSGGIVVNMNRRRSRSCCSHALCSRPVSWVGCMAHLKYAGPDGPLAVQHYRGML